MKEQAGFGLALGAGHVPGRQNQFGVNVLEAMGQVCRIPRNAFFCTGNKYGIIEAGFLVDI
jgi:hypothetical protein